MNLKIWAKIKTVFHKMAFQIYFKIVVVPTGKFKHGEASREEKSRAWLEQTLNLFIFVFVWYFRKKTSKIKNGIVLSDIPFFGFC